MKEKMTMYWRKKFDKMKKCMEGKTSQMGLQRASMQLLLSYLAIMLAPAIAVALIFGTASDALLDVQKERAYRLLSENTAVLEQQIDELQNLAGYLAEDERLRDIAGKSYTNRSAEFYSMYRIAEDFPNYTLTNYMIANVHIVMYGKNYLIQLPSVVPTNEKGFLSVENFGFGSYEEMAEAACSRHYGGEVVRFCPEETESGMDSYVVMHSIVSPGNGNIIGAVMFSLNEGELQELMKNSMVDENSTVLICNSEGEIIRKSGDFQVDIGTEWDSYMSQKELQDDYIIYEKTTGGGYNWKIVSITPRNSLIHLIGYTKYIIILLCVASIAIGLFVCLMYWYRRKPVVGRYYTFSRDLMEKGEASQGFWKSLNSFLDGVQNLQQSDQERKEILQREIIGNVLSGEYDSEEELKDDFAAVGEEMPAVDGYYVMVFQYEDPDRENASLSYRRFTEEILRNFRACITGRHWVYTLSHLTFALILPDETQKQPEDIKREAERLNYYFYKDHPLAVFTGISGRVSSMIQLAQAYEEAQSVCAYARFFSIRVPLSRTDMPGKAENFFFPIDVEMQLEQTILRGSAQELEKLLGEIREKYLKGSSRLAMLHYYLELLRGIAMRAVEKLGDDEKEKILRRLQEAGTQEEIFGAIRWLQDCFLKRQQRSEKTQEARRRAYFEEVVEDRYSDASFNLAEFSDLTGIPQRRLYREFSECIGQTFSDYLEKVRIRNACRMLSEGMAVKDVAQQTGYASDYSFRRAFKRVIGMAPSEFQKKEQ